MQERSSGFHARIDILMELIDGGHMVSRMNDFYKRGAHLNEEEVLDIATQIGEVIYTMPNIIN